MQFHNPHLLPLVPEKVLREHHVYEPYDTRFRAAARLLQSLWREQRDLPFGYHDAAKGRRRLGSKLAPSAARGGANFLTRDIDGQARCDLAYREPGALIDTERVFANLLSSTPLAFNLLVPLKTDLALARRVFSRLAPDVCGKVAHLQFEHSPGRGDSVFTADGTAFDAFITSRTSDGRRTFVAIEVKYAEGMTEPEPRLRPRYDELSRSSGLYSAPDDEALRRNPLQQFWRQHMLAQAMVDCGLYDAGVFMLIAPRQNREVQRAARRYRAKLADAENKVTFLNVELEEAVEAIRRAGNADHAAALTARYLDFTAVHALVRKACFSNARRKRPRRTSPRPASSPPSPQRQAIARR